MGNTKTQTDASSSQQGTQQATMTPQESAYQTAELNAFNQTQPYQTQNQINALNLSNNMLTGNMGALPQYMQNAIQGITPQMANQMAYSGVQSANPQLQQSGIYDSGTAASVGARTYGDIQSGVAQFNIGNYQQALNMALGGASSAQQPSLATSQSLAGQLAGLRTMNQTGNMTGSMSVSSNPFLNSFYSSLGKTLGSPKVSYGPMSFGGS